MYDDEEYSFKVVCIDAAAAAAAAAAWDIPSISKFEHRLPKINERKKLQSLKYVPKEDFVLPE